jgi:hypothetical protein
MKASELLETYPKAAIVVKQWYLEKMLESLNTDSLPEDFKEHVRKEGVDDDKIATIIEAGPRALFDVFDENGIFISIEYSLDGFTWSNMQSDASELKDTTIYLFRKEAERAAIEQAFELLNIKL